MKKKTITITESSARELAEKLKSKPTFKKIKDEDIDCSDMPEATEDQLKQFMPFRLQSDKKSRVKAK